jgi:hypothetical protein
VLLIALRKKNALAITMSTMPIVKMNSARPRRLTAARAPTPATRGRDYPQL